jgi:DNA (cytosine-5)-methyltransferase 1
MRRAACRLRDPATKMGPPDRCRAHPRRREEPAQSSARPWFQHDRLWRFTSTSAPPGMTAYYNDNDPFAAEWLRNLIDAGHIAPGHVDCRSIADVRPGDLAGFTQCHFFAGIGVWSYALRLAGWPDDRPAWTGSCPCQPFSGAGKRKGFKDERHLWPVWFDLIRERGPAIIIGEQVASRDALHWLDHVQTDMENAHYAFAAADLPVAGVGGPHWRQRLWWVADARLARSQAREPRKLLSAHRPHDRRAVEQCGRASGDMGHAKNHHGRLAKRSYWREMFDAVWPSQAGRMADTERREFSQPVGRPQRRDGQRPIGALDGGRPGPVNGFWSDADWLRCTDGKWRPVEPGTFPLAHGVAGRVGQLRAYGNAICPQVAKVFIKEVM